MPCAKPNAAIFPTRCAPIWTYRRRAAMRPRRRCSSISWRFSNGLQPSGSPRLPNGRETALAANGSFLSERFGALESLPQAPPVDPSAAPPATLVRHVLDRMTADAGPDPAALLDVAATRLAAAFPAVVAVQRGGFFGKGPVESVTLTVPRADDVLRYLLARDRFGVRAAVERYVRGIRLKTLSVGIPEWTAGLLEDLTTYVQRERDARDVLAQLFAKEFRR